MRLLDLFCGAGGAAQGYHRAGFTEIVGVDIERQPRYPFDFIQGDAVKALEQLNKGCFYGEFDAIHASPPCQKWSCATNSSPYERDTYPDLVWTIRNSLQESGRPYVIENVEGAPLKRDSVLLCGTQFSNLKVLRHRLFECSFQIFDAPYCDGEHPFVWSYNKSRRKRWNIPDDPSECYVTVAGGSCPVSVGRKAMGIDWMNKKELNEAIPPSYTEWIGERLIKHISI
jgi:DNA (cytosine-5)-methyltransferase 1